MVQQLTLAISQQQGCWFKPFNVELEHSPCMHFFLWLLWLPLTVQTQACKAFWEVWTEKCNINISSFHSTSFYHSSTVMQWLALSQQETQVWALMVVCISVCGGPHLLSVHLDKLQLYLNKCLGQGKIGPFSGIFNKCTALKVIISITQNKIVCQSS